jgi:hypothetical protein
MKLIKIEKENKEGKQSNGGVNMINVYYLYVNITTKPVRTKTRKKPIIQVDSVG